MLIKLQKYVISKERNVAGDVLSTRYGYVIMILRWRRWWLRKYYLRLLPEWYTAFASGMPVGVELSRNRSQATSFAEDTGLDYKRKSLAEEVIAQIKNNPDRFVLK